MIAALVRRRWFARGSGLLPSPGDPSAWRLARSSLFAPQSLRRYGTAILYPEYRFVHGIAYMCVRPAPVEELPQRFKNAERAFETKLWREDLRRWDEQAKPASIRAHLALQRVDPWALSHEQLLEHLAACYAHLGRMFEQHYRLVAPALLPTGDFIAQISELSATPPAELLVLTRGSAPVSAGAEDGLQRLAEAIRDDEEAGALLGSGDPPAQILAALRAGPGATGSATNAYLEMVECRLIDGFEVGCPCGFELPEVLLKAIRRSAEGLDRDRDAAEQTERVRERVPSSQRGHFDELLAEARRTYRLRDERSVYSSIWAMGLMRRAILAAGERLAAKGRIEQPGHLVDATYDQILSMVRGGEGPSAAELAALSRFRVTHTATEAPQLLGDPPPPPPPLERLPAAAARATRGLITAVGLVLRDSEAASEASVVRGLPASPGVYEGTARVLRGPEELERLGQGDVLVAPATSEAFNVVLPLLGALVTDHGGLLAHAAIVSREFGIPGVVGTRDATNIIADGARVRVDGATGEGSGALVIASGTAVALAEARDEGQLGGKAVALGAALRAGLPVPEGVALPAVLVAAVAARDPAAAAELSGVRASLPGPLAVRSSCAGEDSAAASFAGQHLTRLGVRSLDQLVEAVAAVWRSGRSASALAYRRKLGVGGDPRMGIVVQRLLDPEVAGVLFTRHPVTGADERVIEATWGLGEAVAAHLVRALCLDDHRLASLHALAHRCEEAFPEPSDLEWAFTDADLHLLQRRAITAAVR